MRNGQFATLASVTGIHFMTSGLGELDFQNPDAARSTVIAQDAQSALITTNNAGIPAFLTTYIDPKLIEVLVTPMKAADIAGGETKKGDWTTETAMFGTIEATGEVAAYGDYSEDGVAGVNFNYPQRQSYHYQVITQWGEREMERAGLGRIDYANRLNLASILTLNKFQNKSYFFGVQGLVNYGLLNDPNLLASITPTAAWSTLDALGVYNDILRLFTQLQTQAKGLVEMDTPMTLALSPLLQPNLAKSTQYNVNVEDLLKKNFPNLTVKTAPEYSTASGEYMQLFANEIEAQRTLDVAFTEKLRAHAVVVGTSHWKQKKSQGTWGGLVYRPFLLASMIGM